MFDPKLKLVGVTVIKTTTGIFVTTTPPEFTTRAFSQFNGDWRINSMHPLSELLFSGPVMSPEPFAVMVAST
jgi:hypothetical protein